MEIPKSKFKFKGNVVATGNLETEQKRKSPKVLVARCADRSKEAKK